MKRFYSEATVAGTTDGFTISLDGRDVRTPAGRRLVVPHAALAEAIAAEWLAQEEVVRPATMPLTQLAVSALDRVIPERAAIIDQVVAFAGTDLLCYRAGAPADLARRQEEIWQPILAWAAATLGTELVVTQGVLPVAQPETALAAVRMVVRGYDDLRLTALQSAVAAMGSALLGIALVEERLTATEAFAASQLDEMYQIELWGEDAEAAARRQGLLADVEAAARLLALCARQPAIAGH
jgi:chaperone required for assembly of F1-ATPase